LHCLIIRLSEVRVLVGPPFSHRFHRVMIWSDGLCVFIVRWSRHSPQKFSPLHPTTRRTRRQAMGLAMYGPATGHRKRRVCEAVLSSPSLPLIFVVTTSTVILTLSSQGRFFMTYLKITASILLTLVFASSATAQTTYTKIGGTTFGSDGSTQTKIGNTTFGNSGSTATKIGNTTFGSSGSAYTKIGNTTFGNDGSTATKIGNTTFGNDGSTATKIGGSTFINQSSTPDSIFTKTPLSTYGLDN
jgi:hypothetical protein